MKRARKRGRVQKRGRAETRTGPRGRLRLTTSLWPLGTRTASRPLPKQMRCRAGSIKMSKAWMQLPMLRAVGEARKVREGRSRRLRTWMR